MFARTTALATGVTLALAGAAVSQDMQRYDIADFSEIDVAAGITVNIEAGGDFEVLAQSKRRNGLSRLDVDLDGDVLVIRRKASWSGLSFFRDPPDITVTVTLPELSAVVASSGSTAVATVTPTQSFVAQASSGSSITVNGLESSDVDLQTSSGSHLRISGSCEVLDAKASSGSTLIASELACVAVEADASSGASIGVNATQMIDAEASSGASVRVDGSASQREERESSGGSVVFR